MSFADIDTPISDEELSGMDGEKIDPPVVDKPEAGEVDPVIDTPVKDEAGDPASEPTQDRSPVIPRARFDEVNAKLHAEREQVELLRAQLAEQQQAQQQLSSQVDVNALEKDYYAAMMSGDEDKAIAIRGQINSELFARAEASVSDRVTKQLSEREATQALQAAGAKAISEYPFLDHQSGAANEAAINDVVEWRDFYVAKGDVAHVALEKAVAKVGPMYAQTGAVATAPVDTRKAAALARNAVDANSQPPAQVAGVGNRAAPPKPKIETQKDWDKLSESERDELLA